MNLIFLPTKFSMQYFIKLFLYQGGLSSSMHWHQCQWSESRFKQQEKQQVVSAAGPGCVVWQGTKCKTVHTKETSSKKLQEIAKFESSGSARKSWRDPENKGLGSEWEHCKAEVSNNSNTCQRVQKIFIISRAADNLLGWFLCHTSLRSDDFSVPFSFLLLSAESTTLIC